MSSSVVLAIPNEVIELSIRSQLGLESPISIWGCAFDRVGEQVCFIIEVDDNDKERLVEDEELRAFEFEGSGLVC